MCNTNIINNVKSLVTQLTPLTVSTKMSKVQVLPPPTIELSKKKKKIINNASQTGTIDVDGRNCL